MLENVSNTSVSVGESIPQVPRDAPVASSHGNAESASGNISPAREASISTLNLDSAVQRLNITSKSIGRSLRFQVDLNSGRSVIQVLDRDTGELIREIPPEKVHTILRPNGSPDLQLLDDLV